MKRKDLEQRLEHMTEKLAAIEHERWSHWQRYLHSRAKREPDGTLVLPADLVTHWERLMGTPYDTLSEAEKESDRQQVRRYLPLIVGAIIEGT